MPVAKIKGFFEANDLDVTYSAVATPIAQYIPSVGQQNDIALATPTDLIAAVENNVPIVSIKGAAMDTEETPLVDVVAAKDSGIKSIEDLAGKRLGAASLSGLGSNTITALLLRAGVDTKSVEWIVSPPPQLADQLKAGRLDAIQAVAPFGAVAVANGGVSLGDTEQMAIGKAAEAAGANIYQTTFVASSTWANEHQDVVMRFGKALSEACAWMQDPANEDEARTILGDHTGLKGDMLAKSPIPDCNPEVAGSAAELYEDQTKSLQIVLDLLKEVDAIGKDIPVDTLVPEWAVAAK